MRIGLLGPLQVDEAAARLGQRDRIVLAALAMRSGEPLSAEQLAEAVWGEHLPPTWAKALQGCVSRLRRLLGHDVIQTLPHGYRLQLTSGDVDAQHFEQLVRRSGELLSLGEPDRAAYAAGQALQLWRGRPLAELEEWGPAAREAGRLTELRLGAEELALEAALQAGRHRDVVAQARAMVDAAPLRERRWTLLALAQYRLGRQAEALSTLQRLKRVLSGELGLDPSPEVLELEDAILRQEPSLTVDAAGGAASDLCPYAGLQPYGEEDAEVFFGREQELARCLERLGQQGVLAVVGPSGSGKSSLVRAGVAAALRRQGRGVQVVVPGRRPMDALSGALLASPRPVLVVDQAEDLFTVCDHPDQRARFVAELTAYAAKSPVVVALRADRTGELSEHPDLARLVERGLFLLGAMSEQGLRAAIESPARQAGLVVEPGLVDLLVREVEGEPGALPLLSHTLRETWLRREGRSLTVAGYQASGGVRGAVAQSAEELWSRVPPGDRSTLKDLMLRLVAAGPEGEPVRARMPRQMVTADPALARVVEELVAARLVTSDDTMVEIAHESLARAWPRLRGWLDDDVEGRRTLHHLAAAADAWETLGRPDSELYRGVRLARAEQWRTASSPDLTATERDFLATSTALERAEEQASVQRSRQQALMIRRLRALLAVAVVLLLVAVGAGAVARRQATRADRAAAAATTAGTEAAARGVAAAALTDGNVAQAVLLALAAVRMDDSPTTRTDLLAALARSPALIATSEPVHGPVLRLALSPSGDRVATLSADGVVTTVGPASGRILATYDTDGDVPPNVQYFPQAGAGMAFSPDGRAIAVGAASYDAPPPVRLLDAATLRPLASQPGHQPEGPAKVVDVAYSANGRFLAASLLHDDARPPRSTLGDGDKPTSEELLVWDLDHPARRPRSVPVRAPLQDTVAVSPDGRTVYGSTPVAAYGVSDGHLRWSREDLQTWLPMGLSHDGGLLAVTSVLEEAGFRPPDSAYLLDTATGRTVRRLKDPTGYAYAVQFDRSADRVLTLGDGAASIWVTASGAHVRDVTIEGSSGVGLAPDGRTLYGLGEGNTVQTFDLRGDRTLVTRLRAAYPTFTSGRGLLSPDGRHLALDEEFFGEGILDLVDGHRSGLLRHGSRSGQADAWSPDGARFAAGQGDSLRVFDTSGARLAHRRVGGGGKGLVTGLAYSGDGSRLLVTLSTGRLLVLDAATLEARRPVLALPGAACCLSASQGGTAAVLTGQSSLRRGEAVRYDRWSLVDWVHGRVVRSGPVDGATTTLALSRDGSRLALAWNRSVQVLDAHTGQPVGPARGAPGHRRRALLGP